MKTWIKILILCWVFLPALLHASEPAFSEADIATAETRIFLNQTLQQTERLLQAGQYAQAKGKAEQVESYSRDKAAFKSQHDEAVKILNQISSSKKDFKNTFTDSRKDSLVKVHEEWQTPKSATVLEQSVQVTKPKQPLQYKLDAITLEQVEWQDIEIAEAIELLAEESRRLDPQGINFVLQVPLASEKDTWRRKVTLSLHKTSLGRLLTILEKSTGLHVRLDDQAVVIEAPLPADLVVETFTVQPRMFETLPNVNGVADAKPFLEQKGILFPAGGLASYFPQTSRLLVKNTPDMLELVRAMAENSDHDMLHVQIETKFVEFTEEQLKAFRIRWQLSGNSLVPAPGAFPASGFRRVNGQTGGLRGVQGDELSTDAGLTTNTLDAQIGRNARLPSTISLAGIINGQGLRVLMDLMHSVSGGNLMSAPKITLQKGAYGKVRMAREFIYPRSYSAPVLPDVDGIGGAAGGANVVPSNPQDFNFKDPKNVGVTMQVGVTDIQSETGLIDLDLSDIEVVEFDGFINYGEPIGTLDVNNEPTTLVEGVALQPVFSVRRAQTHVQLRNGETLVMGGFIRDDTQKVEDKVPVLGDIPLVGQLFRSKIDQVIKKHLVMLTTATLIISSGQANSSTHLTQVASP